MRIPQRLLEHTVLVERIRPTSTKTRPVYAAPVKVACLVVERSSQTVDRRVGDQGETRDAEITSSAQILFQPEARVPLGSLVTLWPGTANERKVQIVNDAFGVHSIAPSSWQAWTE